MLKAYKYRIYPNHEQQLYFAKVFGCVRFIYNKMLADKIEHYKQTETMLKNTPAQYKKGIRLAERSGQSCACQCSTELGQGI
ncbi:helix-turn-helix domain-containing protein [Paenibacillus sp. UY79]|nr:helix-turn-helix domain-containing protein [Paenibacillus farraposensis]